MADNMATFVGADLLSADFFVTDPTAEILFDLFYYQGTEFFEGQLVVGSSRALHHLTDCFRVYFLLDLGRIFSCPK